jgi:PEP-CTERM motif
MIPRSLRMVSACGVFGLASILLTPAEGRAGFDVAAGYDLFQTVPGDSSGGGTGIALLGPLQGVPLGSYNFGGAIGLQNVGLTDTILQRNQEVTGTGVGFSGTSTLTLAALQLETVAPVDLGIGQGAQNYFVTLESTRGGTASTGTITITFGAGGLSGTFSSSLDVFVDIRQGSLTGPIVESTSFMLSSTNVPWTNLPPPGAETIDGVNQYLSGTNGDPSKDFWPGPFVEMDPDNPSNPHHDVAPALVPEPASILMLGMGTIGLGLYGWRRRGRSAA